MCASRYCASPSAGSPDALVAGATSAWGSGAAASVVAVSSASGAASEGEQAAEAVGEMRYAPAFDVLVVEISSFQAERVPTLHARAHALLNITDDHLDRYASFAAYAQAKGNPFERMTLEDAAVIPARDPLVAAQARINACSGVIVHFEPAPGA